MNVSETKIRIPYSFIIRTYSRYEHTHGVARVKVENNNKIKNKNIKK